LQPKKQGGGRKRNQRKKEVILISGTRGEEEKPKIRDNPRRGKMRLGKRQAKKKAFATLTRKKNKK